MISHNCHDIFNQDIRKHTLANEKYGPVVIYRDPTGHLEIALMAIQPGETVPRETHKNSTQFIRIEQGEATFKIGMKRKFQRKSGGAVVVPAQTPHEIENTGETVLKFYTIYSKDANKKWAH